MGTTVGVQPVTRDRLARLKRELGVSSIDDALQMLLEERGELKQRRRSDELLASISKHRGDIAKLCSRYHITRLSVFGSALHGDARPDSDLDLLVEFDESQLPSGFTYVGIERELSELLGAKVDLNMAESLSPYFRNEVLCEAQDVHVAP